MAKAGTSRPAADARRARFVEGLLIHNGNQTQAAIYAGYSKKGAEVRGSELVRDRKVVELLDRRRNEQLEKSKLTADEVLQSLARAVRFDPRKLYNEAGELKHPTELDDETADVLSSIEVAEEYAGKGDERELVGYTKKLKWLDKNTAREQAMKHFGHYEVDNRQRAVPSVSIGRLTIGLDATKLRERMKTLPNGSGT